MSTPDPRLQQAYQFIKAKKKQEALNVLIPILRSNRDDADAWWLMAHAAGTPQQARQALENVLRLRPNHQKARQLLAQIEARETTPPASRTAPARDPFAAPAPKAEPVDPFDASAYAAAPEPFPDPPEDAFALMPSTTSPARAVDLRSETVPVTTGSPFPGTLDGGDDPFAHLDSIPARPRPLPRASKSAKPSQGAGINPLWIILGVVVFLGFLGVLYFALTGAGGGLGAGVSAGCPDYISVPLRAIDADTAFGLDFKGCVEYGHSIRDTVATYEDDGWAFYGHPGERWTIEVQARNRTFDPVLYLYDPTGALIAENDDIDLFSGNLDSRVVVILPSEGTYTVVVHAYASGGPYELYLY